MYWIFILLSFPLLGALIYFGAVIAPEMSRSRAAQKAAGGIRQFVDPDRDYREAAQKLEISPTPHNMCVLAEICVKRNAFTEAISLYRQALTGLNADAPDILASLAGAYFLVQDYTETLATLDRLRDKNPDYQSTDAHLVYARSLEELGRDDEALEEYAALVHYFRGEEARYRYAMLLKELGRRTEADRILKEVSDRTRLAPAHYAKAQREWIESARVELRR
jgi:hypothetical protein